MNGLENILLYVSLALAAAGLAFSTYLYIDQQKRQAFGENNRNKSMDQLNNEIASLKREHAHLTETVSRFRAQSLAGITEAINEREKELGLSLKESLDDAYKADLALVTRELDLALEAIVERLGRLEKMEPRDAAYDARADLAILGRKIDQVEAMSTGFATAKDLKNLASAQVIDRFLNALDDPEERFKCLLASFDSISDNATLGKLAVAYPGKNSWIILKELSDHGVVSDVAAWAMVAGARLCAARGDQKMAAHLYHGARHSFITCGGNQDGLWVVNTALSKLSEGAAAESHSQDAMANIFALKSNSPQSAAPLQLAEFYQKEDRPEVAAILLTVVSEIYYELDSLAYQACLRVVSSLGQSLLNFYQGRSKSAGSDFSFDFLSGSLPQLKGIYGRCPSLDREAKAGLLLAILYLSRTARDGDSALLAGSTLMDLCQPQGPDHSEAMADDFAGRLFTLAPSVFESILSTLDSLELTRKKQSMPLLDRLTAAFMDINSLTRASSCGAKLVDCALESYGDASAETVGPIVTLAAIYRRMERLDLVEECFRQVLEIQYKVYSSESEEIVETMLSLSETCRAQNDVGEADIFLESAIETAEELSSSGKGSDKLTALLSRARSVRDSAADKSAATESALIPAQSSAGGKKKGKKNNGSRPEQEQEQEQVPTI